MKPAADIISHFKALSDILTAIHTNPHFFNDKAIDKLISVHLRHNYSKATLPEIKKSLKLLLDTYSNRLEELHVDDDDVDMNQPKYTVSAVAKILNVTRATVNNWSNLKNKDYIKVYNEEGKHKYILEQHLIKKYKQIKGTELMITDNFREEYSYKTKR